MKRFAATYAAHASLTISLCRRCLVPLLLLVSAVAASAQTTALDKGSSPGLSPGAPAGSYALSDLDTINPYNGNLNFHLPLLQIGGRGQAQMGIVLSLDTNYWMVEHEVSPVVEGCSVDCPPDVYNTPKDSRELKAQSQIFVQPGYGPGTLSVEHLGYSSVTCNLGVGYNATHYGATLTRLKFVASDGTEYELRDQLTNGQPQTVTTGMCGTPTFGFNRGTIFVTADGTSATFISTDASGNPTPIYDFNFPHTQQNQAPVNGYLILRDGTRFWVESTADAKSLSLIRWMRDRNGNLIRFDYATNTDSLSYGKVIKITDSLDREVTFTYTETQDTITYSGFGGASRSIRVIKTALSEALRASYAAQGARTYGFLFSELSTLFKPGIGNPTPTTVYNPQVHKSVILPDGRSYQLRYNPYGALARVELPTGGAIEYDYTTGSGVVGGYEGYEIYRQVVERRVYPDGVTQEGKMKYSYQTTTGADPITIATVKHCNAGQTPFAVEKHYYKGDPQIAWKDWQRTPLSYSAFDEGREFKMESLDKDSTEQAPIVLRRVENTWENRAHVSWWTQGSGSEPANDPRIMEAVTTLMDAGAGSSKVSKQTFDYDDYNNRTDVYEYGYGNGQVGTKLRHTHTDYLLTNTAQGNQNYAAVLPNVGAPDPDATIHIRNLPVKQQVFQVLNNTDVENTRTTYEYDKYDTSANHAALMTRTSITGHDDAFSTTYKTRGNVTATSRWLKDENRNITAYQQYDVAGNVVRAIDARGAGATQPYATTFSYADNFGVPDGDTGADVGGNKNTYAFATSVTNPLTQTAYTQYDYYLGKAVDTKDANGLVTSLYYGGAMDRPVKLIRDAGNLAAKSQTLFTYLDATHIVRTNSDLNTFGDSKLKSETEYDGLGRTIKTRTFEAGVNYIQVEQTYDALGRVSQQSNPYRQSSTSPTPTEAVVWTLTSYDDLGRVTGVRTPDNAVVRTEYNNDVVTVTDQAGKDRQSRTDALGRLVEVTEDPGISGLNYSTAYSYDALDNLLTVTQGSQTRTFTYDSLSRLKSATNPESGLISYEYDDNGNLTHKTDARSVVTTYTYDELNRIKTRSYTDGTPSVTYTYDNQTLPSGAPTATEFTRGVSIGRLVAVTYGSTGEGTYYGYDAVGRVIRSLQKTGSVKYSLPQYQYNLAGALTSETYPSGRVVQTAYDGAGRISTVSGTKESVTKSYASQFYYSSHGAVSKLKLGNGLWEHTTFNTRLQPTEIGLGISAQQSEQLKLTYTYGTTANNGNVLSQTINVAQVGTTPALSLTQTYTYDEVNRLEVAQEKKATVVQWEQSYQYDRYGNRTINAVQTTSAMVGPNPSISAANNKISQAGYSYDVAGNMTAEPGHSYQYDAENRLVSFDAAVGATYIYDGEGHRVRKATGTGSLVVTSTFIYDAGGKLVAEYATNTAGTDTGTRYLTADHLGSTRLVTDAVKAVKARYDYLPFGEEINSSYGGRNVITGYATNDTTRQKFTAKERDDETGLDYFGARYYASTLGRFTGADDPGFSKGTNPQTWNLYAYTSNNPLHRIDLDGQIGSN